MPFLQHFHTADAAAASNLRREFMAFLRARCTADSDYEGAEITFGELVANVARHAPGPIHIVVHSDSRGRVRIDVIDTGPGFTYVPTLPAMASESGRGLYLVSKLCTDVCVTVREQRNVVRAVLPVVEDP